MTQDALSKTEGLPRAHADERLQLEGWEVLGQLFGDPSRYFDLERAQAAELLRKAHRLLDFDTACVWALVDGGQLDILQHQIRMVQTGPGGFDCLAVDAYASADGRHADPVKVRRCYERGATLVLQLLDRHHPGFNRLCTSLSATLGHPCQISAYLTPPNAQGLDVHHDWHDVLVLQVDGTKQFHTYKPVLARPLTGMSLAAQSLRGATPTLSPLLERGDVLYLPRGVPHAADAGGDGSLHLSLGFLGVTWASLLTELAAELYFAEPLEHNVAARILYRPADLQREARRAANGLCRWLQAHAAERLAVLAAQRLVQSFGARPPLRNASVPPVTAIEPTLDGGAILIDPHGSRALDADARWRWVDAHPSDELLSGGAR